MMAAVAEARPGDVVLLHGGCHNPTGADLDAGQWAEVTAAIVERQLLPVVDIAYQGLGRGLEEDAAGLRGVIDACDEVIVAQSCDKNFGVYRDRVGCLFIKTGSVEASRQGDGACAADRARTMVDAARSWRGGGADRARGRGAERRLARSSWTTCGGGSRRFAQRLAGAHPSLAYIATQNGMFSMLPLTKEQVLKLRDDHAIYMADSGRFNILGLADDDVDRFVAAVLGVMGE